MVMIGGLVIVPRIASVDWDIKPSIGLLAKDIDKLGLDIRSFRVPLTRSIKQVIIPSIRTNFAVQGRPAWEQLAPRTIELRGATGPILSRTGALARGATQFNIWAIGRTSATIRSLPPSVRYGGVHQAGYGQATVKQLTGPITGLEAKQRIPQRQFIMFQPEDGPKIHAIFHQWLGERMAGMRSRR